MFFLNVLFKIKDWKFTCCFTFLSLFSIKAGAQEPTHLAASSWWNLIGVEFLVGVLVLVTAVSLFLALYYRYRSIKQISKMTGLHRSVLNTAMDSVITINDGGVIVQVNEATHRLFAYKPEDIIGKPVSLLMPEKFAEQHDHYVTNFSELGSNIVIGKERVVTGRRQDGSEFPVEISLSSFKSGEQLLFTGIIRDITERERQQKVIQEHEKTLSDLLKAADEIVLVFDRDCCCELANSAAIASLGMDTSSILGSGIQELCATDFPSIKKDKLLESFRAKKPLVEEIYTGGKWFEVHWCPMMDIDGLVERVAVFARDISHRKTIEKELHNAKEQAEYDSLSKSSFLSKVSHELRTPLNSILGFSQILLEEGSGQLNALQKEYISLMNDSGEFLLELVDGVLDLSKIEAGAFETTLESTDVGPVVEDCCKWVKPLAAKANIYFEYHLPKKLPRVMTSSTRLKQILLNLISNAIKYNQEGGEVVLDTSVSGEAIIFTIKDTGIGIPEFRKKELFKFFNRLGAEKTSREGTGIGLALVKELVCAIDAEMGFDSMDGQGSEFWVKIPVMQNSTSASDVVAMNAAQLSTRKCHEAGPIKFEKQVARKSKKVLYIEDNPTNIRLVESILETYENHQLVSAVNKLSGFKLASNFDFDLILMDLNLPDGCGMDLFKELRESGVLRNTPVIAVSADAIQATKERSLESGFDAFLSKPLQIPEFLKTVRHHLECA